MAHHREAFVGIISKLQNAVAIAQVRRHEEVRYLVEIATSLATVHKLVAKYRI